MENGISKFRCIIHPTNTRMIKWMMKLGAVKTGTNDEYVFLFLLIFSEQYSFPLPITVPLIKDNELKVLLDAACHGKGILGSEYVKDCLPEGIFVFVAE